jgi:hypothetical protein
VPSIDGRDALSVSNVRGAVEASFPPISYATIYCRQFIPSVVTSPRSFGRSAYAQEQWQVLERDLRAMLANEAKPAGVTEYGQKFLRWSGHAASSSLSVGGDRWIGIKRLRFASHRRAPLNWDL